MFDVFAALKNKLIQGDVAGVCELTRQALEKNIAAQDILDKGLIAGMDIVGERFKCNEFFIPEVMIAAEAMDEGMKLLEGRFAESGIRTQGRVVIGTVKGDLHDIGKNLVMMMLKGAGFELEDLGIDVAPERFIEAVKKGADILAMSSLLTTSMPFMPATIELLKKAGLAGRVKTLIGGAPVTEEFAAKIGADGYASDAAKAVDKARTLLSVQSRD
jgi:5-methyltetrahydrofolate--homocysteine methyltransferase